MPCLNISTNVGLEGVDTSSILSEATSTVAKLIGKPEAVLSLSLYSIVLLMSTFCFFLLHLIFQISDKTFLVCLISMLIPRSHYCCLFGAILFCFVLSCLFFGASLWFTFRWVKLTLLFGDTCYSDLSVIDLWLRWWSGQRDTHCLNFKRTLNPVKGIVEMTCVLFKDFDIILY